MTDQSLPRSSPPDPQSPVAATRSLYRKYRPQTFEADDLVGQEHIVRILRNAIRLDRIAHAYLFCGPRGTGKTTTARLLAKAVNCLDPDPDRRPCNQCPNCIAIAAGTATDVIEIDAASNRGIDDIRDLRERVKYAPVQLRTKFYIVDEAHQITGAAANAFLKTLEEPPAHTKFVLATTDPEELLPTIVSRCQRFDFRRIGFEASVERLKTVATAEGLVIEEEALAVIARHSTGSLRDGLSLLDQLSLYAEPAGSGAETEPVTADMVRGLLGVSRNDRVESLVIALADHEPATALSIVNGAIDAGEDPRQVNRQLVAYLRVLLHQRAGGTIDADQRAQELATRFEIGRLADLVRRFSEIDFAIKHSPLSHLPLELALVEATLDRRDPGPTSDDAPGAPAATPIEHPAERGLRHEISPEPNRPYPSLRDRVRGGEARPPGATRVVEESVSAAPPAIAPLGSAQSGDGALSVEQLADLWPRIRLDVKAINRRIEALLASVDPIRVNGSLVTLVAAYPFHRDRMNTDEIRDVIEAVISRLVGLPVKVQCALRDELPSAEPTPIRPPAGGPQEESVVAESASISNTVAAATMPPVTVTESSVPSNGHHEPDEIAAHEQRLRAAKNIFDAEVIEPPETGP